jgi:dephospho-CoA kinase
MLKVGLTGGYATGKSFVAAELERLGCHLIYADALGHRVLEPDGDAYKPTVAAFGPEILSPEGRIDRKKLGAIVFADPKLLGKLTGYVHPAVFRLENDMLAEFAAQDPAGMVVVEAAILIETGRYKNFNRLILTTCDEETQIRRAMQRDGASLEQVRGRLSNQMPLEKKKRYADFVVDTSGEKSETLKKIGEIYSELKNLAGTDRS